jgi:hypothetical protein
MQVKEKAAVRKELKALYQDVWAYTVPKKDDLKVRHSSSSSLYGEITFTGLQKLIDYLKLGPRDVFFDLGSGVGKVILQIGMTTRVKKAVGIELATSRCQRAKRVLKKAEREALVKEGKCQFLNQDILKADLSEATVLYSCSTAFPMTFMRKLAAKLSALGKPFYFVTLQKMPDDCGLVHIDTLYLDMSWIRSTAVYVFIPAQIKPPLPSPSYSRTRSQKSGSYK